MKSSPTAREDDAKSADFASYSRAADLGDVTHAQCVYSGEAASMVVVSLISESLKDDNILLSLLTPQPILTKLPQ